MRATLGAAEALRLRVPWGEVAALSWRTSRFATATDSATSSAPRAEVRACERRSCFPLFPFSRLLAVSPFSQPAHRLEHVASSGLKALIERCGSLLGECWLWLCLTDKTVMQARALQSDGEMCSARSAVLRSRHARDTLGRCERRGHATDVRRDTYQKHGKATHASDASAYKSISPHVTSFNAAPRLLPSPKGQRFRCRATRAGSADSCAARLAGQQPLLGSACATPAAGMPPGCR